MSDKSHLERMKEILIEAGVSFKVGNFKVGGSDTTQLEIPSSHYRESDGVVADFVNCGSSDANTGYTMFFATLDFSPDGRLIRFGVWE